MPDMAVVPRVRRSLPYAMKYAVALALCLLSAHTRADSWPSAQASGIASPNGQVVVRVVPGTNFGAVYGFSGAEKGPSATAIYYRLGASDAYVRYQAITLLNPVAPIFTAVSDDGELVTLDNWHNMGWGKTVVVYRPDGKVQRSYELAQMYSEAERNKISQSVSSIWWRCPMSPVLEARTSSVKLYDVLGNIVEINLKTGVLTKRSLPKKEC
jgi:hypothetical protein